MTGPLPTKRELKGAKVYIHYPDEYAKTIHIDVEHPEINDIIEPKETTYCAGKEGGFFIGLKKEMQERIKTRK